MFAIWAAELLAKRRKVWMASGSSPFAGQKLIDLRLGMVTGFKWSFSFLENEWGKSGSHTSQGVFEDECFFFFFSMFFLFFGSLVGSLMWFLGFVMCYFVHRFVTLCRCFIQYLFSSSGVMLCFSWVVHCVVMVFTCGLVYDFYFWESVLFCTMVCFCKHLVTIWNDWCLM